MSWLTDAETLYRDYFIKSEAKVLEVSTGFRYNLRHLLKVAASRNQVIYSIDPDVSAIKSAEMEFRHYVASGHLILRVMKAENLLFENEFFDYVASATTAHHFEDLERALKEIGRVMKCGGIMVLVDWKWFPEAPHEPSILRASEERVMSLAPKYSEVIREIHKETHYALVLRKFC